MTRFRDVPAGLARAVLAAIFALVAFGLVLAAHPVKPEHFASDPAKSDTALYEAVAKRMAGGEGYYEAAFVEHRARGYPLKPFVTVRLPTLAWLNAALGPEAGLWILRLLAVALMVAASLRLREHVQGRLALSWAAICSAIGAVLFADAGFLVWHEVWAALLIGLSLHCRGEVRYALSLALGIAAASIRELALPYLAVMAFVAMLEHRRGEAAAWVAGMIAVGLGTAAHAMEVSRHVLASDAASPGWASFGGWRLVLTMLQDASFLTWLPLQAAAIVVPLALLGWAAWKSPTGIRGTLLLAGYCCAFTVIGRSNNVYWGLLLAPTLFVGLAFAPAALADLVRAARSPRAEGARAAANRRSA